MIVHAPLCRFIEFFSLWLVAFSVSESLKLFLCVSARALWKMVSRWVCSLFTVRDTSRWHMMGPRGPTTRYGGGRGDGFCPQLWVVGRGGEGGTVLVHRLAMVILLRTFSHDGIFGQACWGWGCKPSPFHFLHPIESSNPAPSTPFSAKLAREIYLRRYF